MVITVLVVAGLCHPSRISLTDFTDACLTNLSHNVEVINRDWLEGRGVVMGKRRALKTVRAPQASLNAPFFEV